MSDDRDIKPAKPKNGPSFPAPTGDHNDDLMPHEKKRLDAASAGSVAQKLRTKAASAAGVITLPTWACPTHKIIIVQGDPCPKCGKQLLLD